MVGELWSSFEVCPNFWEAKNLQIQGLRARAAPSWTCLTLVQEENSASPVVASMGDTGYLMISEDLLPNGIFCCLFWRAQFDEH